MSTFYSTSTNQRCSTPKLCLSDPGHSSYTETSIPDSMLYLNYSSSAPYSDALAGNRQPQQDCVDLPVATNIISQGLSLGSNSMVPSHVNGHTYHSLKDGRNEMLFMQSVGGSMNGPADILQPDDQQMSLRSQLGILNGQNLSLQQSNISSMQNQGLSLSLNTQIPVPSFHYRPGQIEVSFTSPRQSTSGNNGSFREETYRDKNTCGDVSPHGLSTLASSIPNSKYLKVAHELLDEVVNVRTALKQKPDKSQNHTSAGTSICRDTDAGSKSESLPSNPQESTANLSNELSPSERQDLQNKLTKLLAMLDEVDRRYKKYYHQMQIVVSSFDAIAGCGAAKPYTALALQTISRHFRCLRDAISDQIRVTRKLLGEQDSSGKSGGLSRLRYIDQQLRQQRTMQQFGMMQQQAWRPQRGLPESSVSILRAWLFEHFLHPYPKDSEKLMLARQTGLTRGQVSNWFINARVRLWKPMIEDMYKEEIGDPDVDYNSSSDNPATVQEDGQSSKDQDLQSPGTERCHTNQLTMSSKLKVVNGTDIPGSSPNFQNDGIADAYMNLKVMEQRPIEEDPGFLQEAITHPDGSGRFMAYQMSELGCYAGGGVSLTLGLQHFGGGVSVPDNQQNFLGVRGDEIYGATAPIGADTTDYDYMSIGDQRHRFSSSHLMHDFVA